MFVDCVFCLFKQKTAYELRISDWSLDVCSSDLDLGDRVLPRRSDQDTDEFRENSYRDRDHEDDEEEERQPEGIGHPRLIAINAQSQSTPVEIGRASYRESVGQYV